LISKQYEVFVCSRAAGSYNCRCCSVNKMHFAIGAALAAVLFITLTQNLRLCSAEAGIVLNLFL